MNASDGSHEPIPAVLLRIRDLIYETAGILPSDTKLRFLRQRCECRMHVLGVASLREYHHCLTAFIEEVYATVTQVCGAVR